MPIDPGQTYTRQEIHDLVGGGSLQSFLPSRHHRVLAGCFDRLVNSQAPLKVDFGTGPQVVQSVRDLAAHPAPIPVFVKEGPDRWRYVGRYRPVAISRREQDLEGMRADAIGVVQFQEILADEPDGPILPIEFPEMEPRDRRVFGAIAGVPEGATFANRRELHDAGIHRPLQAGISGSAAEGADSIVVSGGYEDDDDLGDVLLYTGHGGKDPASGRQVADQSLTAQNLALALNEANGNPVRVVRGAHRGSAHAPATGYRYDGLHRVVRHWPEIGKAGFRIWRFRLEKIGVDPADTELAIPNGDTESPARRVHQVVQRIVRNTEVARTVKRIHDHTCQICGIRLAGEIPGGPYAEGAHIRPLGAPHNGPDVLSNILCLCPNHHVLFDLLAFAIEDDGSLIGLLGTLRQASEHTVSSSFLSYHRALYWLARIRE